LPKLKRQQPSASRSRRVRQFGRHGFGIQPQLRAMLVGQLQQIACGVAGDDAAAFQHGDAAAQCLASSR